MSGAGTVSGAPSGSGGSILPGGSTPGTMAVVNPTMDQVISLRVGLDTPTTISLMESLLRTSLPILLLPIPMLP